MIKKIERAQCLMVLLIFLFSFVSFIVSIAGASARIHFVKPFISSLFLIIMAYLGVNKAFKENHLATGVAIFTLFWALVTVPFNYQNVSSFFSGDYFLMPYFCIVFASFRYSVSFLKFLRFLFLVSAFCFIIIIIIYRDNFLYTSAIDVIQDMSEMGLSLDTVTKAFCMAPLFLLLLFPNIRNITVVPIIVAFFIAIVFSFYIARRNLILTLLLFLIAAYYCFVKNSHSKSVIQHILLVLVAIVFIYFLVVLAVSIFTGSVDNEFFSEISRKVTSDSRSHVTIPFLQYMNESPIRWIFGAGVSARYYSDLGWRNVVETGYLQIVFKVGIVGLACYLFILVRTLINSWRGNFILRACCCYILVSILETYYAGVPTFELKWALVWICVGICSSSQIRSLSDRELKEVLCS